MKNTIDEILNKQEMQDILKFARSNYIPVLLTETAQILYDKLKQYNPKSILEIGTAIGYSGTLMLLTCNAFLTTIEKEETSYNTALNHFNEFNLTNRVNQKLGDALLCLEELLNENKKFDFIFLDGPKGQYIKYLPIITNLLNPNGILFADNVYFKGMVLMEGTIPHKKRTIVINLRKFLVELEHSTEFKNQQILNIGDGVAIAQKV